MKLKVLGEEKFFITGFGEFNPGETININDIDGDTLLGNPNFKLEEDIKIKKSKKKILFDNKN